MASHGFGSVTLAGLISFLTYLEQEEWKGDDITPYLATKKLPEDISKIGPYVPLKLDMYVTITAASQAAGSNQSDLLKTIDTELDTLQDRLELRIKLKKLEGTPEEQAAAARCEEHLVIPGVQHMAYKDEIAHARQQVVLATQPSENDERPLRDDVALIGLTDLIQEIGQKAEEFDKQRKQSELTPSARLTIALRECGKALNHAYEALSRLEYLAPPHGTLFHSVGKRRAPLDKLRRDYSNPRPRATPAAPSKPKDTTSSQNTGSD